MKTRDFENIALSIWSTFDSDHAGLAKHLSHELANNFARNYPRQFSRRTFMKAATKGIRYSASISSVRRSSNANSVIVETETPSPESLLDVKVGQLERLILIIVTRKKEGAYSVSIRKSIEEVEGKPLSVPQLHTTLKRLVTKGLLLTELSASTKVQGGKRKQCYTVTAAGAIVLEQVNGKELKRAAALTAL